MDKKRISKISGIATPENSDWGKRRYEDKLHPGDTRTAFQHDRDRILHSTAFRRLQYKTQVYAIHEGDLYRTRLTHSLEVAQIARGLAFLLGADCDLAEAISLAHDLGHAPFGHDGGEKLKELLRRYGVPFDHNVQSYRIVSDLEERYPRFKGLNLTHATLEGILRHHTPFDPEKDIKASVSDDLGEETSMYLSNGLQPSFETQIVNMADIIAYSAHDSEDALAVGLISWDAFKNKIDEEKVTFVRKIIDGELKQEIDEYKRHNQSVSDEVVQKVRIRTMSRLIIDYLIREVHAQTRLNVDKLTSNEKELWIKIREHESTVVALPRELERQVKRLVNNLLLNHVYREPRVIVMMEKGKRIIEVLFRSFMHEPHALPRITQARLADYFAMTYKRRNSKQGKAKLARVVGDYLAGMTDKYAMDTYQLLTQAYEKAL